MKTKIMNKFSYKTPKKYIILGFALGAVLLFGLISPSFVDASITVTGPTTTTICHSPSVNISVAPTSVPYNDSAVLHWTSSNTNYCTVSASPYNYQWNSSVNLNGDKTIYNLTKTTTFTITCNSYCHSNPVSDSVTIYIQPAPTRYSCNTNTWQCVVNSYGPYTSLSSCEANCQAPAPTRYSCNYSTYQCYQTTYGPYTSYNDCANACQQNTQSLSISCYASPNPAQTNQTVTFSSNVSGGSGNYSYYWSGATYGNNSYSQKSFSSMVITQLI